jgi:hypothetical protein
MARTRSSSEPSLNRKQSPKRLPNEVAEERKFSQENRRTFRTFLSSFLSTFLFRQKRKKKKEKRKKKKEKRKKKKKKKKKSSNGGIMVPISPMISIPFKKTEEVNFASPLKDHILQVYQTDPENFSNEIKTLQRYRQDIRGLGRDANARDILYRYYSQLEFLDLRFPIHDQGVKILFTW